MLKKSALILVDLQNDFCPGGNLAIKEGDEVIPLANTLQSYFDIVLATKDWHPLEHMSFAVNHPGYNIGDTIIANDMPQILWPLHCVQGTHGAEFHPRLQTKKIMEVFHKGVDTSIDSYSAFFDNAHLRSTGLGDYLRQLKVTDVYIMGLATDYCVKYSSIDALELGFEVHLITDGCRGVNLNPGDVDRSIQEMRALGVHITDSSNILKIKCA